MGGWLCVSPVETLAVIGQCWCLSPDFVRWRSIGHFFSFKWVIDFNSEKICAVNSTVHHINVDTYMKIRNIIIQTTYPEKKTENYLIIVNIRI